MQLDADPTEPMGHCPLAVELSKQFTIDQWFNSRTSWEESGTFSYTAATSRLWRECLEVLQSVIGPAAAHGVLYWSTGPFNNPDYELFVEDFWTVMGQWPQSPNALTRRGHLAEEPAGATSIAHVSGFLLNMVDMTVKMMSPCPADDNWPTGHWTVDYRRFTGASSLESALTTLIDHHSKPELGPNDPIHLRSDIRIDPIDSPDVLNLRNNVTEVGVSCRGFDADRLARVLTPGDMTLTGLPPVTTGDGELTALTATLKSMYRQGLFEENPALVG
jgi:hypothetical protein